MCSSEWFNTELNGQQLGRISRAQRVLGKSRVESPVRCRRSRTCSKRGNTKATGQDVD